MKKKIFSIVFAASACVATAADFNRDLVSNEITPEGWVKEFLQRQEQGLGLHPEESGFPFNTKMWCENMSHLDREIPGGDDWWPYEQTAYYLDGSMRCAYMNGSQELMQRPNDNIKAILASVDSDGRMHAGNLGVDREGWPMLVIMRMLIERYEVTKDAEVLRAIERHYKASYKDEADFVLKSLSGFEIRPVLNVEILCDLYAITGDKWYLDTAEKLYTTYENTALDNYKAGKNRGLYNLTTEGMLNGAEPSGHAVTYHEFLKLPVILYMYTGKERYRDAFYKGFDMLEMHRLADGGYSNCESLDGQGSDKCAECCSLIDFTWTAGWSMLATGDAKFADMIEKILYNAAFSAVHRDFKAYQYYQMPNYLVGTNSSSFYNDNVPWGAYAKGRLSYRPGHDTECCAGNIHRMLPTVATRSTMVKGNSVKLSLYMPLTINTTLDSGAFSFTEQTNYPFEHSVKIVINEAPSAKVDLGLRVPSWADSYTIKLNGKSYISGTDNAIYKSVIRKFSTGDIVEISFDATPTIDERKEGGVAINYGSLVFSYPIEATYRKSTCDSGHKCSEEFPAYEYMPRNLNDWAVALPADLKEEDLKVTKRHTIGYPWDYGNSPIKITVDANRVANWRLNKSIEPTTYPSEVEVGDKVSIDLVPQSTTTLRITEFPKMN